ncbi:hypothetical protein WJX81_005614, partial [Elliptochloris bilobata]
MFEHLGWSDVSAFVRSAGFEPRGYVRTAPALRKGEVRVLDHFLSPAVAEAWRSSLAEAGGSVLLLPKPNWAPDKRTAALNRLKDYLAGPVLGNPDARNGLTEAAERLLWNSALSSLPESLPVCKDLEPYIVPATDAREALHGSIGLRVRADLAEPLKSFTVLGPYRSQVWWDDEFRNVQKRHAPDGWELDRSEGGLGKTHAEWTLALNEFAADSDTLTQRDVSSFKKKHEKESFLKLHSHLASDRLRSGSGLANTSASGTAALHIGTGSSTAQPVAGLGARWVAARVEAETEDNSSGDEQQSPAPESLGAEDWCDAPCGADAAGSTGGSPQPENSDTEVLEGLMEGMGDEMELRAVVASTLDPEPKDVLVRSTCRAKHVMGGCRLNVSPVKLRLSVVQELAATPAAPPPKAEEEAHASAEYKRCQAANPESGNKEHKAALAAVHRACAEQLLQLCQRNGGVYIKAAQLVSTIQSVPKEYRETLEVLQDRVDPRPYAETEAVLERELGAPVAELFAELEQQPHAAASLAQVHRAVLWDGREVAVKVQYAGLEATVGADLACLAALAAAAVRLFPAAPDLRWVLAELRSNLAQELDFRHEAENAARLGAAFAKHRGATVPAPVPELSGQRILTMEFVE